MTAIIKLNNVIYTMKLIFYNLIAKVQNFYYIIKFFILVLPNK